MFERMTAGDLPVASKVLAGALHYRPDCPTYLGNLARAHLMMIRADELGVEPGKLSDLYRAVAIEEGRRIDRERFSKIIGDILH